MKVACAVHRLLGVAPDAWDSARHVWNTAVIWKVCHATAALNALTGNHAVDGRWERQISVISVHVFSQTSNRLGAQHCSIMHLSHQGCGHAHRRVTVTSSWKQVT